MTEELFIWRPILEGLISLADVKLGVIDIDDLGKLNALMDMRSAAERRAMNEARQK